MQSQGVHDRRSSAKPRKRNGRRLRSVTCPTTRALPDKRKNTWSPKEHVSRDHDLGSLCRLQAENTREATNVVESFSFTTTRGHSYNRYDYVYLCVISFPAIAIPQPVLSLLEGDLLPQAPRVYPKLLPMVPTWRQHHDRPEPVNGRLRSTTATCGTTALGK